MRDVGTGHYENFPVASILCPPHLRAPIRAIYAFARTADDIADEGQARTGERLEALARYRQTLHLAIDSLGTEPRPQAADWPAVFQPLAIAIRDFTLPTRLLEDLLDAFEQDVRNPIYETRDQLLDYCRRSANPVGRLLLHLYRIDDAESLRASDAICTALQLINFWQDLSIDLPRGRNYLPRDDCRRHGVVIASLGASLDEPTVRNLVHDLVQWAACVMCAGAELPRNIPGRAGWELRLVVHGGWRILERIAQMEFRPFAQRPRLRLRDTPTLCWRAVRYSPAQFASQAFR